MPEKSWGQGFLMPELPAEQPWKRCLYCAGFELWEGTLASYQTRKWCWRRRPTTTAAVTAGHRMPTARPGPTGAPNQPPRSLLATTERGKTKQNKKPTPRRVTGTVCACSYDIELTFFANGLCTRSCSRDSQQISQHDLQLSDNRA